MSYRRTLISDRYHYESVNQTIHKRVESPPKPSVTIVRVPSVTSIVSFNRESRPKSFRGNFREENVIDIKVEHERPNFSSTTRIHDQNQIQESNQRYNYSESFESIRRRSLSSSALRSKSLSQISKLSSSSDSDNESATVTYFYDNNDNNRQVTYIRHAENEPGLSLAGCLVKASPSFLPVNRSHQLGAIFNGSSFGLLTEHFIIKDDFKVSFDFKTTAKNGILMIIVDESSSDSFFVELYDSQLKATMLIDGEPDSCWSELPSSSLNNDAWVNATIQFNGNCMTMRVKNEFYAKRHRHELIYPIKGDLFVAGHPGTIKPPFACRSRQFFIGEMRNFSVNGEGIKWYGIPSNMNPRLRNWY